MEELLREVDRSHPKAPGEPPRIVGGGPPTQASLSTGLAALTESIEADDPWVLLEPPNSPEALARAAVPPPSGQPVEISLSPDTAFTGALLRQVRESRGLSVFKVCDRTRIAPRHLENIEADRYDQLPVTVYLRGMLMNLARELGLNPSQVSRSYLELAKGSVKP
jgi:hypothetical protein